MTDLRYNFLNNDFVVYQNVENPKVTLDLPLYDEPLDISDWASGVSDSGIPIVKNKVNSEKQSSQSKLVVSNSPEENITDLDQSNFAEKPLISNSNKNAQLVINSLMKNLNLTKAQAAGIAGVLTAESGINPQAFNKEEKAGTNTKSSANNKGAKYGEKNSPWSYGAGIGQWTFTDRKEKAIMGGLGVDQKTAKNIITTGGIESLSLNQQIKMLEYELNNNYRNVLEGIRKCNNASEAAATFYCHAIAGYSKSTEKATLDEIKKMNERYSNVGSKSLINKGMGYAEGYAQ